MPQPPDKNHALARMLGAVVRLLVKVFGWAALCMVVLAATPAPWAVFGWLGRDPQPLAGSPDCIVVLGGGGIPSESGLMRTYHAARMAAAHPKARVVVAMPFEAGESSTNMGAMARELQLRGVARDRLRQEGTGRHTREQAVKVRAMLKTGAREPVLLLVTSPEHMRRARLAFRKAGFTAVHGSSVFSQDPAADLTYGSDATAGEPTSSPSVGKSLLLRYRLWDNVELEVRILRELTALAYYKVKGWT